MSYIFISHSSDNDFEAIAIQNWLVENGWDELFLDLDPKRGISAGERWERALHDAAGRCDAVLFCVSQQWLDSEWCRKEFRLSLSLNKNIIGILVEEIEIDKLPDELTSTWQLVNLTTGNDHTIFRTTHPDTGTEKHVHFSRSGLVRLKAGLLKAGLDPLFYEWPPKQDTNRSPYRGMLPLEADDAGIFFGREAPTNELIARLRSLRAEPVPSFMAILGASGAGKSSFLRAGILPRIEREDRHFLPLPVIRPEQSVLWGEHGLLQSLNTIFGQYKLGVNRGELRGIIESVTENSEDEANIIKLINLLLKLSKQAKVPQFEGETDNSSPTLILAIDQSEELFNSEGSDEANLFLNLLTKLYRHSDLPLIILFTIRSDSYEALQTHDTLDSIVQQTFSLSPMPQGAYKDVIEGPAARLKDSKRPLKIDPELTEKLLEDIEKGGTKDALPLLAFSLERLYLEYGGDGSLTLEEYKIMGGIGGAIEAAVEQALLKATNDNSLPNNRKDITNLLRRGLIPWLAGIDPDTQAARRRVAKLSEIPTEARPIIDHLIEQRLLSTDIDTTNNETTLEPAHEALLRKWGLLQGWLKEDFVILTTLENLQRASRDWAANNRDVNWLSHTAGRLEDAEQLIERTDLKQLLKKNDWGYLNKCRQKEDEQRDKELAEAKKLAETQKHLAKRTTTGMVVALILVVAVVIFGKNAEQANKESKTQLIEANHNFGLALYEKAKESIKDGRYKNAAFYSAKAIAKSKESDVSRSAADLWVRSLNSPSTAWVTNSKDSQNGQVTHPGRSIAYSPNGLMLASGSWDSKLRLWDVDSGKLIVTMEGHEDSIYSVQFSPGGQLLATSSGDGTVKIWDVNRKKFVREMQGHKGAVTSIDFSSDGLLLISGGTDKTVRIWNVDNGEQLNSFTEHQGVIYDVKFSPDDLTAASVSEDKSIILRNISTGKVIATIVDSYKILTTIDFSTDGLTLAFGVEDGSINLWNTEGKKITTTLTGHKDAVVGIEFSTDGKTLISSALENTIKVWDIENKELVSSYRTKDLINGITYSPDNKSIAGAENGLLQQWESFSGKTKSESAGDSFVNVFRNIKYSKDGLKLFAAQDDGIVEYNTISGQRKRFYPVVIGITKGLYRESDLVYSHDVRTYASAQANGNIQIRYVANGNLKSTLIGHKAGILSIVFSRDGSLVASSSEDGTTRIWDSESGKEKSRLDKTKKLSTFGKMVFGPYGMELVTSGFNSIKKWDVETGKVIFGFPKFDSFISHLELSKFGRVLAIALDDHSVHLLDYEKGTLLKVLVGHKSTVTTIDFSNDEKLIATGSHDQTVRIWDLDSGIEELILRGGDGPITSIAFSRTDMALAVASDYNLEQSASYLEGHRLRLWDLSNHIMSKRNIIHNLSEATNISFSPDGNSIVSSIQNNQIKLWDIETGILKKPFDDDLYTGYRDIFSSDVVFSPNGLLLALSSKENDIKIINSQTGNISKVLKGHSSEINKMSFSPDGTILISASGEKYDLYDSESDNSIRVWDTVTGRQVRIILGHLSSVKTVDFSPDGTTIASGSLDTTIRIWDVNTGIQKYLLQKHDGVINSVSFSPDGKFLASGSDDNTIHIWDISKGKLLNTLRGHYGSVNSVDFSDDGLFLVSGSSDMTIRVWDVNSWEEVIIIKGNKASINSINISPNGQIIASGAEDGTIRYWNIEQYINANNKLFIQQWIDKKQANGYSLNGLDVEINQPLKDTELNLYGDVKQTTYSWSKNNPFYWLKSANSGDSESMLQLGRIAHRKSELKNASHWYNQALKAGHPKAKQRLKVLELTSKRPD